jgi:uncharacterized protein (TIGR03435 family)
VCEKLVLFDLPRLVFGAQVWGGIMRSISFLAAVIAIVNGSLGRAQDAASAPTFEVASVKLNTRGGGMVLRPQPGGRLAVENFPLRLLIQNAYDVRPFQISGGPGWLDSERYDITAKAEGNPSVNQMMGPMLQALLRDRFQLRVHRETRELPVFTVVPAKGGIKLQESSEGDCADASVPPAPVPGQRPPVPCGRVAFTMSPNGAWLEGRNVPMQRLAFTLANILGRTVIDKTAFTGTFDMHLEVSLDEALTGLTGHGGPGAPSTQPDVTAPSIFTAFQEQLGIKLEAGRGPVEILVIGNVARPTGN